MRPLLGRAFVLALMLLAPACFSSGGDTSKTDLVFKILPADIGLPSEAIGTELPADVLITPPDVFWAVCAADPTNCSSSGYVGVRLESASCDDGSCDVTLDPHASIQWNTLVVRVTGHRAGATRLSVVVRGVTTSEAWAGSWPLTFLPVTRVRMLRGQSVHGSKYGMLPGAVVSVTTEADSVAPDGTVTLLAAEPALVPTLTGSVFTPQAAGYETDFTANVAGTATLDLKGGGVDTTATLRVADPGEVVCVAFVAFVAFVASAASTTGDIDADPLASEAPLTRVTVGQSGTNVGVLLTLKDGTKVLGGAGLATLSPSTIAVFGTTGGSVDEPPTPAPFVSLGFPKGARAATGTLSITVNGATASVPVSVDPAAP